MILAFGLWSRLACDIRARYFTPAPRTGTGLY